jgi:hypothetical protein
VALRHDGAGLIRPIMATYDGPDRRQHRPAPDDRGLPLWLKGVVTLGIPGAIAVYLVWVGSNELPRLNNQALVSHSEIVRLRETAAEQLEQLRTNYRMLQRLCANTAKLDADRQQCFDK